MRKLDIAYYGVQLAAENLNFPVPEVYIIQESKLVNKGITGFYSFKNNEITFNEDWINRSQEIEVVITAFHEARHAYQGYCVNKNTYENEETISKWREEFTNYLSPSGENNEHDDVEYLNQAIEVDAIRYTHLQIYKLFGVKTEVPEVIRNLISI